MLGASDDSFLCHGSGFEVARLVDIPARRKTGRKAERSILVGHREERMIRHADVAKLPRMQIAFHPDEWLGQTPGRPPAIAEEFSVRPGVRF